MAPALELTVPAGAASRRLDAWLAEAMGASSRAAAQQAIDAGGVLVDGRHRPKSYRLKGGERLSVESPRLEDRVTPPTPEPRIAWEDEDLLIVDKPAGLVVHPAPGHRAKTLMELLAERAAGAWTPLVVHRLDRNTSGLMIVAKNEAAQRKLQGLVRRRAVLREYVALVKGRLRARRGTIDAPLGRDVRQRTRISTRTAKPRSARTHFEVERFLEGFTLVRAQLETGRTHQIRAHFAAIGHPVCGDVEYGAGGLLDLRRQFLHSARIALVHPASGRSIERRSHLPNDLATALQRAQAGA